MGVIPAGKASGMIRHILKTTGVKTTTLAHGVDMAESQVVRLISRRTGTVKSETLTPIQRAEKLVEETSKTLSESGLKSWLTTPNPYLRNVAPILCLRSDEELEKVLSLLVSIRHGLPA